MKPQETILRSFRVKDGQHERNGGRNKQKEEVGTQDKEGGKPK